LLWLRTALHVNSVQETRDVFLRFQSCMKEEKGTHLPEGRTGKLSLSLIDKLIRAHRTCTAIYVPLLTCGFRNSLIKALVSPDSAFLQ
jgi:hypothetical protein